MKRFYLLLLGVAVAVLGLLFANGIAKTEKSTIELKGVAHVCCADEVKSALKKVDGVKSAEVSIEKATATVEFDAEKTNVQALETAVADIGFDAGSTKAKNSHKCGEHKEGEAKHEAKSKCGGCPKASSCEGK